MNCYHSNRCKTKGLWSPNRPTSNKLLVSSRNNNFKCSRGHVFQEHSSNCKSHITTLTNNCDTHIEYTPANQIHVKLEKGNKIEVSIGQYKLRALIDTGATISCISTHTFNKLIEHNLDITITKSKIHNKSCILADGTEITVNEIAMVPLCIDKHTLKLKLYILHMDHLQIIIGCDVLQYLKAKINFQENTLIMFSNQNKHNIHNKIHNMLGHIQFTKY